MKRIILYSIVIRQTILHRRGADGESRTPVSTLGSSHNSRYTTPAMGILYLITHQTTRVLQHFLDAYAKSLTYSFSTLQWKYDKAKTDPNKHSNSCCHRRFVARCAAAANTRSSRRSGSVDDTMYDCGRTTRLTSTSYSAHPKPTSRPIDCGYHPQFA